MVVSGDLHHPGCACCCDCSPLGLGLLVGVVLVMSDIPDVVKVLGGAWVLLTIMVVLALDQDEWKDVGQTALFVAAYMGLAAGIAWVFS